MAEVAVDERRLLKTMRWYDGLVIGLANPGFLLIGLAFSILALGGMWAVVIWIVSAAIGALQAYIYCEPAAMFPDKPGGLSVYAREGWRKHFSLAGPIAVFGYWFAWSSVLAIYGSFVGLLLIKEFGGTGYFATESWDAPVLTTAVTWPTLIGVMCIVLCYIFNVRGMRPAVWFSYAVGALMLFPVGAIAIGAFLTGDFSTHEINTSPGILGATTEGFGSPGTGFDKFALIMVWLYIIGWSTYGPEAAATFAPEYKDTKNDTRKALAATGFINTLLAVMLPIAVIGTIGYGTFATEDAAGTGIAGDPTGVVYLVDVLHRIAGDGFGAFLTVCLCGGLLLSMNTATMDGSRALYALSEEKMTVKQLGVLNSHHVPGRAMTVDMLLNMFLLLYFGNIFFILAAGNLGYVLSHVLALTGFLWLRRDRPNWPRPIKLARPWVFAAGFFAAANLAFIVFGLWKIEYTGYLWNAEFTDALAKLPEMLGVALGSLGAGVLGYVVAQYQHGRPFRWREPADEQPSQEAIDAAALPAHGR
jgi:amino acid transporter